LINNNNNQINYINNLSKILSQIYYSNISNKLNIQIIHNGKVLFSEEGNLYLKKDYDDIFSYHILGENLSLFLFENTGKT